MVKVVQSGNIATSGIKDFMGDFGKKLGKLGSLLGAFGSMTGVWGTSVEVKKLDEIISTLGNGFKRIEDRFDKVDESIKRAEKTIMSELDKMAFRGRVKEPLQKLRGVKDEIKSYMQASSAASRATRKGDLNLAVYKNIESSIKIIVNEFTGDNEMNEELCGPIRKVSHDDRKMALTLMMSMFNAIAMGASHLNLVGTLIKRGDVEDTKTKMMGDLRKVFTLETPEEIICFNICKIRKNT